MNEKAARIIQLTDLHIFKDPEQSLLGVQTFKSLLAIIDLIKRKEANQIDALILTGDLSQDGSLDSYQLIASQLSALKVPIYALAGNHDCIDTMYACYQKNTIVCKSTLELANWQFVLLNSQWPGHVAGTLDDQQLAHLQETLQRDLAKPTIIMLHHHPLPIHCQWLDKLGLTNAELFWSTLQSTNQVKAVLFGHVHQVIDTSYNAIPCVSAPATCIQFKPKVTDFALDNQPPGYRWLELYADGSFKTGVVRLEKYIGEFLTDVKGY